MRLPAVWVRIQASLTRFSRIILGVPLGASAYNGSIRIREIAPVSLENLRIVSTSRYVGLRKI